jgi:hypothetical protein
MKKERWGGFFPTVPSKKTITMKYMEDSGTSVVQANGLNFILTP